jgi:SOS response regulatory protein OraA/RecX
MIIEERAYKYLAKNFHSKAEIIAQLIERNISSEQIAIQVAGQKVIMGCLVLLAANYLKKCGPP